MNDENERRDADGDAFGLRDAMSRMDARAMMDRFRQGAQDALARQQEAYTRIRDAGDRAQRTMEVSVETAREQGRAVSMKAIEAIRANVDSGLTYFEKLTAARTLAEVVELQTAFLREQAEAAVRQAREMQELSAKAAEPARALFEETMDGARTMGEQAMQAAQSAGEAVQGQGRRRKDRARDGHETGPVDDADHASGSHHTEG